MFGPRPPTLVPSHSRWKSQPSRRWRYAARTSRYSGASSVSSPGNRTGDSLTSSCSRGPRWQSYRTKSRLAAYGTMRPDRKLLPGRHVNHRQLNHRRAPLSQRGGASYRAACGSCRRWVESGPCRVPARRGGGGASQRDQSGWRPAREERRWT